MNAWTIYWILQLDSLNTLFCILSVFATIGAGISVVAAIALSADLSAYDVEKKTKDFLHAQLIQKVAKCMSIVASILLLLAAFLPTTKTAAAMVILPAVVNNQKIQAEAGDLYNIAKQALRKAAGAEESTKTDKDK